MEIWRFSIQLSGRVDNCGLSRRPLTVWIPQQNNYWNKSNYWWWTYRCNQLCKYIANIFLNEPIRVHRTPKYRTRDRWTLKRMILQWPASTRNRLSNENYMTANFYRNTFFNQLITTTAAEGVETYVATLVFAYENQGLDLYRLYHTKYHTKYHTEYHTEYHTADYEVYYIILNPP